MHLHQSFEKRGQRRGELGPDGARLGELPASLICEPVVTAVRAFGGRDDIRRQRAGLVQAPQRPVDGRVPDVAQARSTQPADDVVAVAVLFGDDCQSRGVERALQELRPLHLRATYYYAIRNSSTGR